MPAAPRHPPRSQEDVVGLRVLAHPLRLRLLSLLTGRAYSAAEAARVLDQTQANVSYHLRRLLAAGLVELVEEVEVRGGTAKRYRHDPDSGGRLTADSTAEYLVVATALGEELRRRAADRAPDSLGELTDAELWLDPEDWHGIRERARRLGEDLHAAARPPEAASAGAVRVSATVVLFEMTGGGDAGAGTAGSPEPDGGPGPGPRPASRTGGEGSAASAQGSPASGSGGGGSSAKRSTP
ncbi:ArsR family transcriptional regulator [Streptomyces armeniacus]|uniref:ArsR family transcriptional regulator n=1 Tax=Streptomyces armeniacus TaxID=83291 RepID=A0A345XXG0_9ACTN|nr:helix-turn-helix domain-containing protein [Streptomyces armeniacus]AXK36326.1 ArsR family transcriptional regulator [Streptomyces armeniacus]